MQLGDKAIQPEEKLTRIYPEKICLVTLLVRLIVIIMEYQVWKRH